MQSRVPVLSLLFFTAVCCVSCQSRGETNSAQSPPPPLIYSSLPEEAFKPFIDPDNRVSVNFPGKPEVSREELEGMVEAEYRASTKAANWIVVINKFSSEIESRPDVWQLVDAARSKQPGVSVVKQVDIHLKGIPGKETECQSGIVYFISRTYIQKNYLYEIRAEISNWHIISEETKKIWRSDAQHFFDSFNLKEPDNKTK